MAEPVGFPQANAKWTGENDVGDLPVYIDEAANISCWQLTAEERAVIQSTGVVWLHVWGATHPAVYVSADNPFPPQGG